MNKDKTGIWLSLASLEKNTKSYRPFLQGETGAICSPSKNICRNADTVSPHYCQCAVFVGDTHYHTLQPAHC